MPLAAHYIGHPLTHTYTYTLTQIGLLLGKNSDVIVFKSNVNTVHFIVLLYVCTNMYSAQSIDIQIAKSDTKTLGSVLRSASLRVSFTCGCEVVGFQS